MFDLWLEEIMDLSGAQWGHNLKLYLELTKYAPLWQRALWWSLEVY